MLAPQRPSLFCAHLLQPRITIHHKQRIHARHHFRCLAILQIHLHWVHKLAPRVCPAAHVHQLRPADVIVRLTPWLDVRARTSVSALLEKCVTKPQAQWTQGDKNRVGRCLRALGWERYRERERERLEWRWRRAAQ